MKPVAIMLTGPTASGKTALSLALAKKLGCEIISCDSMQIYRGMDVGTAKATAEEQSQVRHHLIDVVSPAENYSVERYRADALECVEDISSRGLIPLFVGGTGLYADSFLRSGQQGVPESDPAYRAAITESLKTEEDVSALWEKLRAVDPESADAIHKNNIKRVIRALEIYDTTGITKTELDKRSRLQPPDILCGMITLDFEDRELLYRRIDSRVEQMMEMGLLEEVSALLAAGLLPDGTTASQAIGYKEIISHLRGECSLCDAVESIKLASRRYAKRQLTWFRKNSGACRVIMDSDGKMRPAEQTLREAEEGALAILRSFGKE